MKKTAQETYNSFIIDSTDAFLDSCNDNAFDALRALQRVKKDWTETEENKDCRKSTISLIEGVEALIVDIAEAQARYNHDLLINHEQS